MTHIAFLDWWGRWQDLWKIIKINKLLRACRQNLLDRIRELEWNQR